MGLGVVCEYERRSPLILVKDVVTELRLCTLTPVSCVGLALACQLHCSQAVF